MASLGTGPARQEARRESVQRSSLARDHNKRITTIEDLPNELLIQVCSHLDDLPPSASTETLADEPGFALTRAKVANLKTASLLSKRWRSSALPLLFKHAQFIFPGTSRDVRSGTLLESIQPFLDFIRDKSLARVVKSFVLLVPEQTDVDSLDKDWKINGFASFWKTLYRVVDPLDLVIVSSAEVLGALTFCHVSMEDASTFDSSYHYLRLQQNREEDGLSGGATQQLSDHHASDNAAEGPSTAEPGRESFQALSLSDHNAGEGASQQNGDSIYTEKYLDEAILGHQLTGEPSSPLLRLKPWSTLLLNEGSFIRSYASDGYWMRQPPSILPSLLGADETHHRAYITPTIKDLSYISIFPTAAHFNSLIKDLPRIDRLFTQIVPRGDILASLDSMVWNDVQDLWMERNSCYALLMREIFSVPPTLSYRHLKVFESGDAADRDAWTMAVEYVKRAGHGWRVAGEGVFVKDPKGSTTGSESSANLASPLSV